MVFVGDISLVHGDSNPLKKLGGHHLVGEVFMEVSLCSDTKNLHIVGDLSINGGVGHKSIGLAPVLIHFKSFQLASSLTKTIHFEYPHGCGNPET